MFAKQCLAVWSTLWRRPGAWLVAAVLVAGMIAVPMFIASFNIRPRGNLPREATPHDWVRPQTLSTFNTVRQRTELAIHDRQRPLWVSVSGLIHDQPTAVDSDVQRAALLNARASIFKKLSTFTQVVGASWRVPAPDADALRSLAALPGLQGLQLDSYDPVTDPLDLRALKNATQLERLDLGWAANPDTNLAPLAQLPRLSELAFTDPGLVTPQHMATLAALPRLRRLYLPALDAHPDSVPALAALNASTTLNVVHLPLASENEALLARVRKTLPQLSVRRGRTNLSSGVGHLMSIAIASSVLSFLGMQFAAWFSSPAAVLTPHHASAHRVVGWALLGLSLLGMTAVIAALSVANFWPLLVTNAAVSLVCLSQFWWTGIPRHGFRNVLHHMLNMVLPAGIMLMVWIGSLRWVDAHLRGDFPLITVTAGLFALVVAWFIDRHLQGLARNRLRHHLGPVMCGNDYKTDAQHQQTLQRTGAAPSGWWPRPSRVKPDTHRWSPPLIPLIVVVGFLWSQGFFSALKLPDLRIFFSPVILGMTLFFPLSFTSRKWAGQFALMPQIMLRPAPRGEHINRFFRAAGRDFARLWPAVLVIAALYGATQGGFTSQGLYAALAMGLLATSTVGLAYAVVLLAVPHWEQSGKTLMSSLAMVVLFGSVVFLPRSQTISITLLSGLGLAAVLAAVVLTFIAHARYQSIEWGKH